MTSKYAVYYINNIGTMQGIYNSNEDVKDRIFDSIEAAEKKCLSAKKNSPSWSYFVVELKFLSEARPAYTMVPISKDE